MNTEILVPSLSGTSINIHSISKSPCDYIWDMHIHKECEFCMSISGEKIFYIKDREYVINDGDIIFVNENVPHKTKTFKGSESFLIQAKSNNETNSDNYNLSCYLNKMNNDFAIFKNGSEINTLIKKCFEIIIQEDKNKDTYYELFIKSAMINVFAILYRYGILAEPIAFFNEKKLNKILPAIQYIEAHYNENITLDGVSSILNVDKSHFCRMFKKATGTSYIQYLNFVRIQNAENLLLTSDKNIADIAQETGFSSPSYFAETFKAVMNCSPSQYKKIKLEKYG